MAQRLRFIRLDELHEELALVAQPLVERLRDRRGDRIHALERRGQVPGHGAHAVARELEEAVGVGKVHIQIAHPLERALLRDHLAREGERSLGEVAGDLLLH